MGSVYFAQSKDTLTFYALKTPKSGRETYFLKEARLALSMQKHPNIIYTYTLLRRKDNYGLVMEYIGPRPHINDPVQGDTLRAELTRHQRGIEKKQALQWAIDFCFGMEYFYAKGLISHNDLKPENLFITSDNVLKVGDFGLVNTKWDT